MRSSGAELTGGNDLPNVGTQFQSCQSYVFLTIELSLQPNFPLILFTFLLTSILANLIITNQIFCFVLETRSLSIMLSDCPRTRDPPTLKAQDITPSKRSCFWFLNNWGFFHSHLSIFWWTKMFSQTLLRSQWLSYSKHYTVFPSVSFLSWMLWMPLLNCCFSSKALFLLVVHIYRQVAKLVTLTTGKLSSVPVKNLCFAKEWSCVLTVTSILYMRTEDKICNQSGFPLMVEKYYTFQAQSHSL